MENNIRNYEALVEATTISALEHVKSKIEGKEYELKEIYESLERAYDEKRFLSNFNIKEVYTNRLETFKQELKEYLADENNPDISSVTCKSRSDTNLTLALDLNAFKNIPLQKFISNSRLIFNLSVSEFNTLTSVIQLASSEMKENGYPATAAQCILPLHINSINFYFSDKSGFTIADNTKLQAMFSDKEMTTIFFYNPANILAGSSIVNLIKQTIGLLQLSDFEDLGYKHELTNMISDSVPEGTKVIPSYANTLQAISIKNSDAVQNDLNLAQPVNPEEALARYNAVHHGQIQEAANSIIDGFYGVDAGEDTDEDIEEILTDDDMDEVFEEFEELEEAI